MNFQDKLSTCIKENDSLLCIGLDPVLEKLPESIRSKKYPFFEFNKAIIDATNRDVCAYKPNTAFYEALGDRGVKELKMTCDFIHENYPLIPIILDAKRGDIGNTNNGYVEFAYDYLNADAITLSPYLGRDAIQPFLDRKDKGCILLCKTSNPGGGEFQNLEINGEPLYKIVAQKIAKEWNTNDNCCLVVGATYPQELKDIRGIVGNMTLLVPGVGAQGGDLEGSVKAGLNSQKSGLIISTSRAIIYASSDENFAKKAFKEAGKLKFEINHYRN